jgi:CRP-like cAMP-binding protein
MRRTTAGSDGALFDHLLAKARAGDVPSRARTFARGEVVFHEGDPGNTIHLIEDGMFAVRAATTAGRSLIINVLAPGAVFGEFAVFSPDGRRTSSVTSLAGGTTTEIERDGIREALRAEPVLAEELMAAVVVKAESTRTRLIELLSISADLRVLRALLMVDGLNGGDGSVPLTQSDLASLAATTRPTANRVLREEQDRGTLRLTRGGISVVDPDRLAKRAGLDPPLR